MSKPTSRKRGWRSIEKARRRNEKKFLACMPDIAPLVVAIGKAISKLPYKEGLVWDPARLEPGPSSETPL